ncbi:MAG: recombinase family protein [Deltaproteobacteria bacterium]|nr:recombinase family protein [Deltaproteobacteria bacterium]
METDRLRGKKVALYARYSSQLQREASIEDQLRRCREWVVARGGVVDPDLVFVDAATSGASLARPGFESLMRRLAAKPPIEVIVTEDLSRITRDFADAGTVFKKLQYLGILLVGIADGIDTSAKHAKLTYGVKALIGEVYLDDLRDKTKRGLEGRRLAGYSTGGLPIGYRSAPVLDAYERTIGHRIEVDPDGAAVVLRIFSLYLEGRSHEAIARLLNDERVPPPRARTRHRRKGWVASTIRAILHNEAYVGRWTYNRNEWRKVPGTNARRPRPRDTAEHMVSHHDDRRILDDETWSAVQRRLREVRRFYTATADGAPKGRAAGRATTYPLSGILHCGACGAPLVISGGSSARYYRCADAKKRGTCRNNLSLREDVVRRGVLEGIADRLSSPAAIAFLRERVAHYLSELGRSATGELSERRERLERTKQRIQRLVQFVADGDDSAAVRSALRDLEAQARAETTALAALVADARAPIELPTPDQLLSKRVELEQIVATDPTRGREELRRLFEGGRLLLHPQADGSYVAETKLFLLRAFSPQTTKAEPGGSGPRATALGCAGRN